MTITKTKISRDEDEKTYKLSEVKLRNGKDFTDIWIVFEDSIYDVTHYIDSHPGGTEIIMQYAGQDCTKDFNDTGHSQDAAKDMKHFKIGKLVEVSSCKLFRLAMFDENNYQEDCKSNRAKSQLISNGSLSHEETKKKKKLRGFLFC